MAFFIKTRQGDRHNFETIGAAVRAAKRHGVHDVFWDNEHINDDVYVLRRHCMGDDYADVRWDCCYGEPFSMLERLS